MMVLSKFNVAFLVGSIVCQMLLVVIMLGVAILGTAQPCIAAAINVSLQWGKASHQYPLANIEFSTTIQQ